MDLLKFSRLSLILYLSIGFLPYFGAVDKHTTQFVYLSVLNSITLLVVSFNKNHFSNIIRKALKNKLFWMWALLALWSFMSLFYAQNKSEVIIESSRILIYAITVFLIYIIIVSSKFNKTQISSIFSIVLTIEVLWVLYLFFERFSIDGFSRDMGLRAFAGNINITAFAILIKLPLLIFYLDSKKVNFFNKALIFFVVLFTIYLIGSRGANITIILISIAALFFEIFVNKKSRILKKGTILAFFTGLIFSITVNQLAFEKSTRIKFIERTIDLNTSSTQQRINFYKDALNSIKENFFFGIGSGNWKLISIEYDLKRVNDYVVPYHVHNDFLEIFAELGFVGIVIYLSIYFYLFYLIWKTLKYFNVNNILFLLMILLSLTIYNIDSFLNFPFTRPLMQLNHLVYLTLLFILIKGRGNLNSIKDV